MREEREKVKDELRKEEARKHMPEMKSVRTNRDDMLYCISFAKVRYFVRLNEDRHVENPRR